MDHPLDGARGKIRRAIDQLNALKTEMREFINTDLYRVDVVQGPEPNQQTAIFRTTGEAPLGGWAIILGEILHDLRSALDHAVYQLTIQHSNGPVDLSEFPIFLDKDKYYRRDKNGIASRNSGLYKIRGVSPSARAFIEGVQPFLARHEGIDPAETLLGRLQALSNIDKHRTLHLAACATSRIRASSPGIEVYEFSVFDSPVLDDGTILARWRVVRDVEPQMRVEFEIPFEVVLDDEAGPGNGAVVAQLFDDLILRVQTVVDALSVEFLDGRDT